MVAISPTLSHDDLHRRFFSRRGCLALGAALLSEACARRKGAGYPGYALVSTAGEDSVAVIDLTGFRLVRSIPLGAPPSAAIPAAGGYSYVLTPATDSVHVLDQNLKVTTSRRLGKDLGGIRLAPDGRGLLAISGRSRQLIETEAGSLRVLRRFALGGVPGDFDVSPGGYVALSMGAAGGVELVHLPTGQQKRVQLPGPCGAVRFRADGRLILVANLEAHSLTALDVPTLQVVAELPLAMRPDHLCFNSDQGQLFVSGAGMDGIAIVFPYDTLEVEQTVLAGRDPGFMACSESPAYLFVGSASVSNLCILDVESRKVIGLLEVSAHSSYIAITPDNQYVLVLDEASGDMAVIHIPAIRPTREANWPPQKNGAALLTMLNVGSRPVHAAIVPRMG
jgi:DNA-binding beta-propeller fold protein YncE